MSPHQRAVTVVECVNEDLALKRGIFCELERLAPPDIPLASN